MDWKKDRPPAWYTLDVAQKDRTSVPLSRPAPMPERQPARSDRGLPDLGRGRIGGVGLGPLTLRSIARDYADILDDDDPRQELLRPLVETTP